MSTVVSNYPTIYRYNFNKNIIELLNNFTKMHKYDTRKDYQEAWKSWYKENSDELEREAQRIINLGYMGNVEEKMYRATRYYFRKKNKIDPNTNNVKEVKVRTYITLSSDLLKIIDLHIRTNIMNPNYSPAWGFNDFCNNNKLILENEIRNLSNKLEKNSICSKIKKTYKNRYFQYSHNQ